MIMTLYKMRNMNPSYMRYAYGYFAVHMRVAVSTAQKLYDEMQH